MVTLRRIKRKRRRRRRLLWIQTSLSDKMQRWRSRNASWLKFKRSNDSCRRKRSG
jgi:hypothetical protein